MKRQKYHDWRIDYGDEVLIVEDSLGQIVEKCSLEELVSDELDKKKQPFDEIVLDPVTNKAIVYYNDEEACEPYDLIDLCEKYVDNTFCWDGKSNEHDS